MREISLTQISKPRQDDNLKEVCSSLEKALVAALQQLKPAPITVESPTNNIQVSQSDQSYMIEVKRDGHGRISTMLVRPYESS